MTDSDLRSSLTRIQRLALVAGVVLTGTAAAAGLLIEGLRAQFFTSYLTAFMLWIGLALGCLALLALHNLTSGHWGRSIRRVLESGAMTMPLMAVLFLPLLAGLPYLYDWTHYHGGTDKLIDFKMRYWLNEPMFIGRAAGYLVVWIVLAWILGKGSGFRVQGSGRQGTGAALSGVALLLYVLGVNFAAIDWVMSMQHGWYSTIFGLLFIAGQAVSTMAVAIIVLMLLSRAGALKGLVGESDFQDLGSLLLAFVMLWAYLAFSQYLIIWTGNISHETSWYVDRLGGGWKAVGVADLLLHFAVPFVLLLQRRVKRSPTALAGVAGLLVVMRLVDMIWLVQPNLYDAPAWGVALSPLLWLGLGGLWVAAFLQRFKKSPLPDPAPAHAPASAEEVAHV